MHDSTEATISLADVVLFFRAHAVLIFGLAVLAGVGTGLVVRFVMPTEWRASAMLAIVPPKFSSDLKPGTLTVQGYQKLAESDAIIGETKRRLVEQGVLKPDAPLRLGDELKTEIFVSQREERVSLAPLVQLIARTDRKDAAPKIANTWASVVLDETGNLLTGSTSPTIVFIQNQFPQARKELLGREEERLRIIQRYSERFSKTKNEWETRLAAFKQETNRLVSDYQSETFGKLADYKAEQNVEVNKQRLDAMLKTYSELQAKEVATNDQLLQTRAEYRALTKVVADVPQYIPVSKAITDDALWQSAEQNGQVNWQQLQQRKLVSQEVNGTYQNLKKQQLAAKAKLDALLPRSRELNQDLDEKSALIQTLTKSVNDADSELERIKLERERGLGNLQLKREQQLNELTRTRDQELGAIKREWDTRVAQIERDIEQQKALYTELAKNYNEAQLANAQSDAEDLRMAGPAVAPDEPLERGTVVKAVLAAIIGGILGTGLAIVREAVRGQSPVGPDAGTAA